VKHNQPLAPLGKGTEASAEPYRPEPQKLGVGGRAHSTISAAAITGQVCCIGSLVWLQCSPFMSASNSASNTPAQSAFRHSSLPNSPHVAAAAAV